MRSPSSIAKCTDPDPDSPPRLRLDNQTLLSVISNGIEQIYSPTRRNTRKQQYTSAFDRKSSAGARRQTTKEEGSKEKDTQEGTDVKHVKNEYVH